VKAADPHTGIDSIGACAPEPHPSAPAVDRRVAQPLEITHSSHVDRAAMRAALRVALGLPRQLPSPAPVGDER
jgi:hypothetical protein